MTGFIGVGQLRYILTNLGEKMSDDEVDELLKAVDTSSGEINYMGKDLFQTWGRKKPELTNNRLGQDHPRQLGTIPMNGAYCALR